MKRIRQLLTLIHEHNRSILPVALLSALVQSAQPFISLFLSARVLELVLERSFREAAVWILIMLGVLYLVGLAGDGLSRMVRYYEESLRCHSLLLLGDKYMELDYQSITGNETQEAIRKAWEAIRQRGGFGYLLYLLRTLASHVMTIIMSCALVATLLFLRPTNNEMVILNNPFVLLLLSAAVLTAFVRISALYRKKDLEFRIRQMQRSFDADIVFQYYGRNVLSSPQAFKSIQINGMSAMLLQRLKNEMHRLCEVFISAFPQERKMTAVDMLLSGMVTLFSYFLVILRIFAGAISVAGLLQYTGAVSQFSTGFLGLTRMRADFRSYMAAMEYTLSFLERENRFRTGSIPVEKRLDNVYELEFHDVSFAYPGASANALSHVNLKIGLKRKTAIVGPNGAGKTTFIQLLCRLYDPTEGMITLNGIDIRKYDYEEYLSLFGIVFQDFVLFPYSVKENVAAGYAASEQKVMRALNDAGIGERISRLEEGLDTAVFRQEDDGGVNFSGGELQKLAIARALYKDAPIVILDEPTAALDPLSEYEIYSHFDEMVRDKTSIFISHRMSSCRFCDDIVVFDRGRVDARGSHEELLRQGGLYASMWEAQAQYYTRNKCGA